MRQASRGRLDKGEGGPAETSCDSKGRNEAIVLRILDVKMR
jgi:hypothetical protein